LFVPAAQYVRASTERQQYSIEYQSRIISQYASEHGFEVVRTFSDEARSGLDLKYRPALRQVLAEVMRGQASFRFILVFDVSRWGRFQDTDEAAHYEYVCKSAGIPIHYCAEQFSNEGSIADSLLKTLKRFMAGEFSRDLSARAAGGLNNIVARGFKYGAVPGYGLRRMLVGSYGRPKQLLAPGELKNISSDRVVFVPGPFPYLCRRVRLEHKDAPQHRVVHERPGDHKFVFGSHLADVGHVLFLKLFARLFAQLRSVGGTIQQYEEVLDGGVRLGLGLRESRARNHEEAEQKHIAGDSSSHTRRTEYTQITGNPKVTVAIRRSC